jgi:hypothetical protein
MNKSTYDYLQPTAEQRDRMERVRAAAALFARVVERELPDGPDKTW